MAPSAQGLESPTKPGRFKRCSKDERGVQRTHGGFAGRSMLGACPFAIVTRTATVRVPEGGRGGGVADVLRGAHQPPEIATSASLGNASSAATRMAFSTDAGTIQSVQHRPS